MPMAVRFVMLPGRGIVMVMRVMRMASGVAVRVIVRVIVRVAVTVVVIVMVGMIVIVGRVVRMRMRVAVVMLVRTAAAMRMGMLGRMQQFVEETDRDPVGRGEWSGRHTNARGRRFDGGGGYAIAQKGHALDRIRVDDLLGDGNGRRHFDGSSFDGRERRPGRVGRPGDAQYPGHGSDRAGLAF